LKVDRRPKPRAGRSRKATDGRWPVRDHLRSLHRVCRPLRRAAVRGRLSGAGLLCPTSISRETKDVLLERLGASTRISRSTTPRFGAGSEGN
jgi:hypothetical protein